MGKNRVEALGEIEETADLISYYNDQMRANDGYVRKMGKLSPTDDNVSVLRPYGVWAVIAPWNFPYALLGAPAAAALLTGNTVVMKPSSETPLSAVLLAEIFAEAGLPPGTVNCLTGSGRVVGDGLAKHPDVDGLTFTGSLDVGFKQIYRQFSTTFPKPCIVEMGGKNPAIVMDSADLDRAASGIYRSAFGMNGHKCSACSRLYVHEAVADDLLTRLDRKIVETRIGDPLLKDTFLGPVATRAGYEDFQRFIDMARATSLSVSGGAVRTGGAALRDGARAHGYFVEPTVVTGLAAGSSADARRAVRAHLGGRARDQPGRGAVPGQRHAVRPDGGDVQSQASRDRYLSGSHPGRRRVRQSGRRGDDRRVAGRPAVWWLEGKRFDRQEHRRHLHPALLHARAKPHGVRVSAPKHSAGAVTGDAAAGPVTDVPLADRSIQIVVRPPGPVARQMIAHEQPFVSPSLIYCYPLFVRRASGCMVEDVDGNVYLDAQAGVATASTGHCHPAVAAAIAAQAQNLIHICGTDFHYEGYGAVCERLNRLAAGLSPGHPITWQTFLTNSGTEGVEAALKLARNHTERTAIIAFRGGFHGRTFGSLSLTASKTKYRKHFGPFLPGVYHAEWGDAASIETELFAHLVAPEDVAAIVVEPVLGEGGYLFPPVDFCPPCAASATRTGSCWCSTRFSPAWDGPARCSRPSTTAWSPTSSFWPRGSRPGCRSGP